MTPADTTSHHGPGLATALREFHGEVSGLVYPHDPGPNEVSALVQQADGHDVVIVGTVNATSGQIDLVERLAAGNVPLITVALREPTDLAAYAQVSTHLCTYSSHVPSLRALARALFGGGSFTGRLPMSISSLYPIRHRL